MEIVFASNNPHKIREIRTMLNPGFSVLGLADIGCRQDIPEPYRTLEENALAKARFVFRQYGRNCFSDDSGLEVEALGGLPGVRSARFAGPSKTSSDNIEKLLGLLKGHKNRNARFRAVMALIIDGREFSFEGVVNGRITQEAGGSGGFGYDPVFVPEGHTRRFSEMSDEEKNRISHRYRALEKLTRFLREYPV
ncbi:MAG: RdgB/HAM1 family non-canonical purine NTP pyrophosphatase [Bacteroidales bacterium]